MLTSISWILYQPLAPITLLKLLLKVTNDLLLKPMVLFIFINQSASLEHMITTSLKHFLFLPWKTSLFCSSDTPSLLLVLQVLILLKAEVPRTVVRPLPYLLTPWWSYHWHAQNSLICISSTELSLEPKRYVFLHFTSSLECLLGISN